MIVTRRWFGCRSEIAASGYVGVAKVGKSWQSRGLAREWIGRTPLSPLDAPGTGRLEAAKVCASF